MPRRQSGSIIWAISLVAAFGVLVVLYATRWGVGASPDSVTYIGAARNLAQGKGFTSAFGTRVSGEPVTWFPPMYPVALASGAVLGADPYSVGRWVQSGLLGLSILLFGLWAERMAGGRGWFAIAGAVLILVSASVLPTYIMAWSEALFILLAFAGFWFLSLYLCGGGLEKFIVAGGLLGLAWLTRYSGVAYVATGGLGILLFSTAVLARRVRDAVLFGIVASLPMAALIIRNRLVAESGTGRQIDYHPIGMEHFRQALDTAAAWMTVPQTAPGLLKLAGLACIALALVLAAFLLWRGGKGSRSRGESVIPPEVHVFLGLQLLSVMVYAALLVFSISFVDANTPLDDRILAPVYGSLLFVTSYVVYRAWLARGGSWPIRVAVVLAVVLIIAMNAMKSTQIVRAAHSQGIGWSGVRWNESVLMEEVRALPPETVVYSNAPDGVYLHTDRPVIGLPRRTGSNFVGGAEGYEAELRQIAADIGAGAVIVRVDTLSGRSSSNVPRDLERLLPLRIAVETNDGQIIVADSR